MANTHPSTTWYSAPQNIKDNSDPATQLLIQLAKNNALKNAIKDSVAEMRLFRGNDASEILKRVKERLEEAIYKF